MLLATGMLTVSPNERITVEEIMQHPWLASERAYAEQLQGFNELAAGMSRHNISSNGESPLKY